MNSNARVHSSSSLTAKNGLYWPSQIDFSNSICQKHSLATWNKGLFSMSRSIFSLDSFNKKSSQYACSTSLVFIGSFWTNYVFEVKWISQNIFDQHAKQSFWYIVRWQIIFLIHLTGQVDKKITPSINQCTSEKSRWISDLLYILFFESDFKINRNNN